MKNITDDFYFQYNIKSNCNKFLIFWDKLCVHIWLISSSFGIMFAFLSFLQDLGVLSDTLDKLGNCSNYQNSEKNCWGKGVISIIVGLIFYFTVGIRHIYGSKRFGKSKNISII